MGGVTLERRGRGAGSEVGTVLEKNGAVQVGAAGGSCPSRKEKKKAKFWMVTRKEVRGKGSGAGGSGSAEEGPAEEGPRRVGQGVGGKVVQSRAVQGRRVQSWGVQGKCYRLQKRGLKNKIGLNNIWSGLQKHLASMATGLKNEA